MHFLWLTGCLYYLLNTPHFRYSALSAEVPQTDDLSTSIDTGMVKHLSSADRVIVAGQSLSHVVSQTVRDLLKEWQKSKINRIYLAKDCCSPLPGFERQAERFLKDMQEIGINLGNAADALYFKTQEELDAEAAALAREKAAIAAKAAALKFAEEQRAAAAAAQAAALKAAAEAKEESRKAELRALEEAKAAKIRAAIAAEAEVKRASDLKAEILRQEQRAAAAAAEEVREAEATAEIEAVADAVAEPEPQPQPDPDLNPNPNPDPDPAEEFELQSEVPFEVLVTANLHPDIVDAEKTSDHLEAGAHLNDEASMQSESSAALQLDVADVEKTPGHPEEPANQNSPGEEARLQSEASAEAEAAAEIENMQARIQAAEISTLQLLFSSLAQDASCDAALAELIPRIRNAPKPVCALVIEKVSSPAEVLVSCMTSAVVRCNEEFSAEKESRVKGVCDLLLMLLECDGWTQMDEKPSSSVHMSALKARQQAVLDAGGSDALVAVFSLGVKASDELYALAARVVGRMCRATDLRSSSSGSPSRKSTKIKSVVCVAAQEMFIPHAKALAAQLKVHGSRRESSAIASVCSAIIHIAQENPSAQRRFLDMQTVTVIHDMLKSFPADYSEFSDIPLTEGDTSPRQLIISQKLYLIQALKLVVDPSHRRSKTVNGKVQTLLDNIRDNVAEDVTIKEIANDVLAIFAQAVQSDDGSTKTPSEIDHP
jgi:hypothetical protein